MEKLIMTGELIYEVRIVGCMKNAWVIVG